MAAAIKKAVKAKAVKTKATAITKDTALSGSRYEREMFGWTERRFKLQCMTELYRDCMSWPVGRWKQQQAQLRQRQQEQQLTTSSSIKSSSSSSTSKDSRVAAMNKIFDDNVARSEAKRAASEARRAAMNKIFDDHVAASEARRAAEAEVTTDDVYSFFNVPLLQRF